MKSRVGKYTNNIMIDDIVLTLFPATWLSQLFYDGTAASILTDLIRTHHNAGSVDGGGLVVHYTYFHDS